MAKSPKEFREEREKLNKKILENGNLGIKRFFNLDTKTYKEGLLKSKTKEMLGLVASLVLRCDDCISYHAINCYNEGITKGELAEIVEVGLVVGGSITIPHVRRLYETWDKLEKENG